MDALVETPRAGGTGATIPPQATIAMAWSTATRSMFYTIIFAFLAFRYETFHGVDPAGIQVLVAVVGFAGVVRPLLGALSDTRPMGGYRRKSYAILGHAMFIAATAMLIGVVPYEGNWYLVLVVALLAYAAGESFKDVAYDSYLLDIATTPGARTAGRGAMRVGAAVGLVIAYTCGAFLVEPAWPAFLGILLAMNVGGLVLACWLPEARTTPRAVWEIISTREKATPAHVKLVLGAGFLVLLGFSADGLVNVLLEPWAIARLGAVPTHFYLVEVLGAAIATGAIVAVLRACKGKDRLAAFLVPMALVSAAYYIGIWLFMPDLPAYLAWNTVKFAATIILPMIVDRILMDVVHGPLQGTTFQYFIVFAIAGASLGGLVGGVLKTALGVEGLLAVAAATWVVLAVLFKVVLLPRVAAARPPAA